MHDALESFVSEVKSLGFLVKLDTNGSYPLRLAELLNSEKIDYVAMDIKNTPCKYAKTIGLKEYDFAPIAESMKLLSSSEIEYEYRTTVVREFHTADDICAIAKLISESICKKSSASQAGYYLQCFEDTENVLQKGLSGYSAEEMQNISARAGEILKNTVIRGG